MKKEKKFISAGYWGMFLNKGILPVATFNDEDEAYDQISNYYDKFENWGVKDIKLKVKRCNMGRMLIVK